MKKSKEIFNVLNRAKWDAINAITDIMKSQNASEYDLTVDRNGLRPGDDGYDEGSAWEDRVWVECFGKYSDENGYVTRVTLKDGCLEYDAKGEASDYDYSFGSVEDDAYVWASILGWIEKSHETK